MPWNACWTRQSSLFDRDHQRPRGGHHDARARRSIGTGSVGELVGLGADDLRARRRARLPVGRGRLRARHDQWKLKGEFTFTATSLTATFDTPSTSVVTYTADLIIRTQDGTLTCKDAGALATNNERSMASVCTIVAGTGEFLGSTGRLRIAGISPAFDGGTGDTSGHAEYEGEISSP